MGRHIASGFSLFRTAIRAFLSSAAHGVYGRPAPILPPASKNVAMGGPLGSYGKGAVGGSRTTAPPRAPGCGPSPVTSPPPFPPAPAPRPAGAAPRPWRPRPPRPGGERDCIEGRVRAGADPAGLDERKERRSVRRDDLNRAGLAKPAQQRLLPIRWKAGNVLEDQRAPLQPLQHTQGIAPPPDT